MRLARLAGVSSLVAASAVAAALVGRPAFAVIADKAKDFSCSSRATCVKSANTGKGDGLDASSEIRNGVFGRTQSNIASGVYGEADNAGGGAGVAGRTVNGTNGASEGVYADGGAHGGLSLLLASNNPNYGDMVIAASNGNQEMVLDNLGNLGIAGLIFTSGSCSNGCAQTHHRVASYVPTATEPRIEDTGEAQLRSGEARVKLDPAFANVIDTSHQYVVLITPEGVAGTLYVAQRTTSGFVVREQNGYSSTPFAYRIVAHPYGKSAPRLPMTQGTLSTGRTLQSR